MGAGQLLEMGTVQLFEMAAGPSFEMEAVQLFEMVVGKLFEKGALHLFVMVVGQLFEMRYTFSIFLLQRIDLPCRNEPCIIRM